MEALFIFIAKSSGLLLLFYCAYYFLLRKETFFNSNRWFLLAGLITSVVLPFAVYTKVVWVNALPLLDSSLSSNHISQTAANKYFEFSWIYAVLLIYGIGFSALLIKFGMDFYSLNSILKGKKIKQQADFKFIDTSENIAPFSYFEYIVYNSSMYTSSELENIIEHEKVHSDQNHTVDVLIARIFSLLFWFNPIIWLYKKAITQNLEFIADKEAAKKLSDKKAYQYTLLKITTHENCVAITNHFYQSLIKKRIIMLNKNQSKKRNSWKYYVVIPALAAFVLLFQVEVIAKEKPLTGKEISGEIKSVDTYKIKKNSTDQELKEIAEKLKHNHDVNIIFSDVKRNSDSDLTAIKVEVTKGSDAAKTFQTEGNKGIKDCGIVIITYNDGSKKISFASNGKIADSESTEDQKTETKQQTKTNSDVKTNHNTNTNVSTNNSAHDTNVNTNVQTAVNVNSDTKSNITVNAAAGDKKKSNEKITGLVIVDGNVVTDVTTEELDQLNIKSMDVYKGPKAIAKFGVQGENGVIVIETKK